jgi:hypothetical protein
LGIGEIGSRSIEDIESAGLTRGQITKGKIKDGTVVCRSFLEEINIDRRIGEKNFSWVPARI